MEDLLPELCDQFPDLVQVVEPMFGNFGGKERFGGEIVTLKAFEDNSLVREQVALPGQGKVLVVDGGGSMRKAMLGDMLAEIRQGRIAEGMAAGVRDVGFVLAQHFPRSENDENELPDRLIEV